MILSSRDHAAMRTRLRTGIVAVVALVHQQHQQCQVMAQRECTGGAFQSVDVSVATNEAKPFKGVKTNIRCPSNLSATFMTPEKISWRFKAIPDSKPLQMFVAPAGFLKPYFDSGGGPMEFEWGPNIQSVNQDALRDAGVEVLLPQSQLTYVEVAKSGDEIFVNLTLSEIETFTATMDGITDKLWVVTADGNGGGNGTQVRVPTVVLQASGSQNTANIIADTRITSDGFDTDMEVLGQLDSGTNLTGSSELLLVDGAVAQSGVSLQGYNAVLRINPVNSNQTDPCAGVDVANSNVCETTTDTVDVSSFMNVSCTSSNEVLSSITCDSPSAAASPWAKNTKGGGLVSYSLFAPMCLGVLFFLSL
jgi:hypothetical protein